jgi:hypothetical protein
MSNYFYARTSKSWPSEKQHSHILKLGSTRHIEFRKWWCSTERLYPSYYLWYLHITGLGRFSNIVSAEKTIFRHPFFSSRNLHNGQGSGEEFYQFSEHDNPLEKACEILVQYNVDFSIVHGDIYTTRPKSLPPEDNHTPISEPLPPVTKTVTDLITPREYQLKAIENMKAVDKGVLVLATGTGKTVIYSMYIQQTGGRYLILVPTTILVDQTIRKCGDILGDTFLCLQYKTGSSIPSRSRCQNLILVGTYQNSENIQHVEDLDCIIFDECNCTVILNPETTEEGSLEYSTFQKLLRYQCKKKFFGTATQKNILSTSLQPISMDDEKIYGPVLYKYTLAEAVNDGYLTDYTFDIVGTRDKNMSCLPYLTTRFKSIIFCANLKTVENLYSYLYDSLKSTSTTVYKLGKKEDVQTVAENFSKCKSRSVIVCCRKINLGYDEDQIDTVIHYDISTSSIMTIQRNGRALRLSSDKVMAKIVFLCDLSGDSESQKEEVKKLQAPIAYLQLYDSRLIDKIKKEQQKPNTLYKSINIKLDYSTEDAVKVYDKFWNLLSGSSITYKQCKELIRQCNPRIVSIRGYNKLSESEPRLPLNPEETFIGEFKGWADYLTVDTALYYSREECTDLIRRYYDQISHIPELSKRCKALRKTDPKFPPPDMWVHVYGLSSLDVIFCNITNKGGKVSVSHDIDSLLK